MLREHLIKYICCWIILLILSQDSSFNASISQVILPSVPWYEERLLHHTSLGSLMVAVLIRTVKYNLSKLRNLRLYTNCLATLANMAPHVHRLSAYASQRLVSLFDMISRKYADLSTEFHIYNDFLRIVLEITNAILPYALPRNPEIFVHIQMLIEAFHNLHFFQKYWAIVNFDFLELLHDFQADQQGIGCLNYSLFVRIPK
ncbi:hypothetical protein QJS04_geneDACA023214 [Acorus gramineus]|uniref:Dymeclin n=1 Tax=Acorus gramineus TaxID=55184 RepID=A0AAV9ANM7_ACOGR|nr:hypothetical protein QJS04_geneDACA023214 [Acorus gramineus]